MPVSLGDRLELVGTNLLPADHPRRQGTGLADLVDASAHLDELLGPVDMHLGDFGVPLTELLGRLSGVS